MIEEAVAYKKLTIGDILRYGTPKLDVLGILYRGRPYAEKIKQQLGDRADIFFIHHDGPVGNQKFVRKGEMCLWHPGTSPENSLIIADDAIDTGETWGYVLWHMRQLGYDFESDSPHHFGAVADVYNPGHCEFDLIRLARDFMRIV